MDINQAKDIVINAGKELVARGLIQRTWGNASQRIDDRYMVITPSGKDYLGLTRDDIVLVDMESLDFEGNVKPSSEKGVHATVYKNKEHINFVIHTHQLNASVVSACGVDGIHVDEKYDKLKTKVICSGYGLPGTKKLSRNIERTLPECVGNGIIMKHHGALCFGADYAEAFDTANQLESACKEYLENRYLMLSQEKTFNEFKQSRYILKKYGNNPDDIIDGKINFKSEKSIVNESLAAVTVSCLGKTLRPYVDDFAQIVGVKMQVVDGSAADIEKALKKANAVFVKGRGAICTGATSDDAKTVSMIVEKNCKAFISASLHGIPKPISLVDSTLMRAVYTVKYSKKRYKRNEN